MIVILSLELLFVLVTFVPRLFNINTYVVTSGSMKPKLPVGSLVYVKKTKPQEVKSGNIITFNMSNDIIATHQVYKIDREKGLFYTQGINNKDENGKIIHDAKAVNYNDLIGVVIYCIPYLGYINKTLTSSPNVYIVISVTFIIVLISFVIEILEKKKRGS